MAINCAVSALRGSWTVTLRFCASSADGDGGRRYGTRGNRLAGAVQKSRKRRAGTERAQAAENGAPGDPSERYVRHSD
jgi:hypothetical protein